MPKGISKNPEETKRKLRELRIGSKNPFFGKKHTKEALEKIRQASLGNKYKLGVHPSEESRKKMSNSHKGLNTWTKGIHLSDEHKKKISIANKGKIVSDETRRKMSIAFTGRKPSEETRKLWSIQRKGKVISEQQRRKQSEYMRLHPQSKEQIDAFVKANKERVGEKHPNWKGGISFTKEYTKLQDKISRRKRRAEKVKAGGSYSEIEWNNLKEKYNFTCPCCKRKEPEIRLTEDHIIPLSKGGTNDIENIQPLCRNCNSRKNTKTIKYEI